MSDTTNTFMSIVTTVNSNLPNLSVTNGQIIFVRDSRKLYFDYDDKRVAYGPIIDLATEAERSSILAPITGSFYYVVETNALWTYRGSWTLVNSIDTTNVIEADNSSPVTSAAVYDAIGDIITSLNEHEHLYDRAITTEEKVLYYYQDI